MGTKDNELSIAPEEEEAYVEFDIATYPSDYTLEILSNMLDSGEVTIPPYQRKYVWSITQASKLIESFLMGLPVPQIFLYVTDQLRNRVLRAINIRQLSPSEQNTSVYHIFERLNTGGTLLKPQEIRNAVFRGDIVNEFSTLNATPGWLQILGLKAPEKSQKDIELILRIFSLFNNWSEYEKPMKEYLNKKMKENRDFDSEKARKFRDRFPGTINLIREALGKKPFRPKRVINAAVLESVMITLLENPQIDRQTLSKNYGKLLEDEEYKKTIVGATTDTNILKDRIKRAIEILCS